MKKNMVVVSIFTVLLLIGDLMFSPQTARAVQDPNKSCVNNTFSTSSQPPNYVPDPNSIVTIDNGAVTADVVVWFSSETFGSQTGPSNPNLIILAYLIDGVLTFDGNGFFALTFARVYTTTRMSIFTLGPGVHTIQPAIASADGPEVTLLTRCLLAANNV